MLKVTRQEYILKLLQENKAVNLSELSKHYNVSTSTIRRDLFELSEHYPVTFTHGGAVYVSSNNTPSKDIKPHSAILSKIGEYAAGLIEEGDTIIIDSGLTTLELARTLKNKSVNNLTIISTNIAVADIINNPHPNNSIVITGGEYRGYYRSLVGSIAEEAISKIKVKKAFIGATGISENGFYTAVLPEMDLRRRVCASAQEIILLADETKFGSASGFVVNPLSSVNKIVTNNLSDYWKQVLIKENIEVCLTY